MKQPIYYEIANSLNVDQIKQLHSFYQLEWWSKGRKLTDVRKMIENCDVIIAFCDTETEKLLAFCRVISDFVYKAFIFDVIVDENYRDCGLGKALMASVLDHPKLRHVKHFELYCLPEMISFYEKLGFSELSENLSFLRREV